MPEFRGFPLTFFNVLGHFCDESKSEEKLFLSLRGGGGVRGELGSHLNFDIQSIWYMNT